MCSNVSHALSKRSNGEIDVKTETLKGTQAFNEFASGEFPFRGKKTPKNPHPKNTDLHKAWQDGYDAALAAWFRD